MTVLGDFLLSEGVDAVLQNLKQIGATAVTTNPTVTAPAADGEGSFQPPVDAGSSPRVFDRPLFGKTARWVRSGVSFEPNPDFYADSPYPPRQPNELTRQYGAVVGEFIRAAKDAGLKVYLQVGAAQPSGLRDEDRPRIPVATIDGDSDALATIVASNRMADTASLASEAVRAYNRAYVRDLFRVYPEIDGFRPDWPESPCYTFGEVFQDFSPHVKRWATERGFDFAAIHRDVAAAMRRLQGGLTNADLESLLERDPLAELRERFPGVDAWLRLKAELSTDFLRHWRGIVDEFGGPGRELSANAFMPRYSDATGFDFSAAGEICDAVSPKLYTMHWSQMVSFWGAPLMEANTGLDESLLVQTLVRLMDVDDEPAGKTLADFGYPAPDEPHPIGEEPQRRKISDVVARVAGRARVTPLVHGYGPVDDFLGRLRLAVQSEADGVWINRYGYLSDAKLEGVGEVWNR